MLGTVLIILSYSVIPTFQWTYKNQDYWPDLCQNGRSQSPINLDEKRAQEKNFSKLLFHNYDVGYPAVVKYDGHSINVKIGTPYPSISGGDLPLNEYILDHLHFHWASEHTIQDFRYPLELHAVHYAKQYENVTGALKYKGGVAVLGILYDYSPDDDAEFSLVTNAMKNVLTAQNTGVSHIEGVLVKTFLPRDTAGYFRYEGSLTTPNCNEGIIWTVFTNVISISEPQVKRFLSVELEEGKPVFHYRSLQSVGERTVYHRVSPYKRNSGPIANYSNFFIVVLICATLTNLQRNWKK